MRAQSEVELFLKKPESYTETTKTVELRETHISEVYLTDKCAYKIKKPMTLPFLDYGTLEARRAACMTEIDLNRRFSQGIYEGLVRITREADGHLMFDGEGPAVEYAVRMRRIPDSFLMDQRLQSGTFAQEDEERLIAHLISCYQAAPRAPISAASYRQRMLRLIDENRNSLWELAQTLQQDPSAWMGLCSRQTLFMQTARSLCEARVQAGRIMEGHGDLRPEHIVLENPVSMIDGIEFNRDLRILDVADELSFLAMECAVMGHESLSVRIRDRVLEGLHDSVPPRLPAFFTAYRATVRAKVNFLKATQCEGEERSDILSGVDRYRDVAEQAHFMRPFVWIVCGAMGSGKTTLARALKQDLGAAHLESDTARQKIFGASPAPAGYGQGHYTEAARLQVYEVLRDQMMEQLQRGMNVIVDASFGETIYQDCVLEPLRQHKFPYLVVICECQDEEAMRRIAQRRVEGSSASEARPELYHEQKKRGNWAFVSHPQTRIDTGLPVNLQKEMIFQEVEAIIDRL